MAKLQKYNKYIITFIFKKLTKVTSIKKDIPQYINSNITLRIFFCLLKIRKFIFQSKSTSYY